MWPYLKRASIFKFQICLYRHFPYFTGDQKLCFLIPSPWEHPRRQMVMTFRGHLDLFLDRHPSAFLVFGKGKLETLGTEKEEEDRKKGGYQLTIQVKTKPF